MQPLFLLLALDGLFLLCTRLLLRRRGCLCRACAVNEAIYTRNQVADERQQAGARKLPRGDADASEGRARERDDPFGVVWEPAMREPEHGLRGIPERNDELRSLCQDQSKGAEDVVELGSGALQALLCKII